MKYVSFLAVLFFATVAFAQAGVPVMSFGQQVEIVYEAKRDARILDVKIDQQKEDINLDVVVDKSTDKKIAKALATHLIMLAKSKSLDDQPKKKDIPGKGLYNYNVSVMRPDGVVLVTAMKPKKADKVSFEDPFLSEPLTREGAGGR